MKPNIVVILADDIGAWALGCAGNREIHTPHLDRLASEGVRFDNYYCTSPVCSPARATLLTGQIPSRHGIHDWIRSGNVGGESIRYLEGQTTYVELLAQAGYVCGISGKWHLGDSATPHRGFSHWFVHQTGGGPYYNAPMIRDGVLYNEPGYITEAITDDALAFLDQQQGSEQPFYLSIHYTAPHSPWVNNHPQKYVDMYADCPFDSCPQEEPHPWTTPNAPWKGTAHDNLIGYYASVTAMDEQIGRVVAKLSELGVEGDTLVCFMSDNGFSCGQHGFWGKGNGTFPLNMYDTSVKVPAIFRQPGRVRPGLVSDALLSGYDFMPTLLAYADIAYDGAELPGASFLHLLSDEADGVDVAGREHVVVYDEYGPVRMVRSRSWKYIHRFPFGPHELYNLVDDPGECRNLVDDALYAETIAAMKLQLDGWFMQYADAAVDGTREAVYGFGQIARVGTGWRAFATIDEPLPKEPEPLADPLERGR